MSEAAAVRTYLIALQERIVEAFEAEDGKRRKQPG
mgnify:CR=1 FL=1